MAIIGNILDDGKPGATQGAVDERIFVSEIFWREKFGKALIAGGYIRRNKDKFLLGLLTLSDFKSEIACGWKGRYVKGFDVSKRGCKSWNFLDELIKISVLSLGIDEDSLFVVENPPQDRMGFGKIINEGSEANSLNDSRNPDLGPFHYIYFVTFF